MNLIKRFLLKLILGKRTYYYLCASLGYDHRLLRAHTVDIVVRKDGQEVRVEADWIKKVARILGDDLNSKKFR
jgi:hypothetical protein